MATTIRLRRGGRTHKPYYRIVVIDSRHRDRGPEVENLGIYHPCARPEPIMEVNALRALEWLKNGATVSDTARSVLRKVGVMKHLHEGTSPEEEIITLKGGVVEDKGYNAPPPPKEKPKAEEAEAEAPAEGEGGEAAEASAEAPAEEAEASSEEEKSE
jgi:small subunit ribosomal protein S16